jgi:predicted transcriptional regulator
MSSITEDLPLHRDMLVLSMLPSEGFIRPKQIRMNLGLDIAETTRRLQRLQSRGLVISLGAKKFRKYMLSDAGINMLAEAKRFYEEL